MSNRSEDEVPANNNSERNERHHNRRSTPSSNNSSVHQDALRRLTCNRPAASFASPMNNNDERRSRSASGAVDEEVSGMDESQVRMFAFVLL